MLEIRNLALPLDFGLEDGEGIARAAIARVLGVKPSALGSVRLMRRSVDARKKAHVRFVGTFAVDVPDAVERRVLARPSKGPARISAYEEPTPYRVADVSGADIPRPIVVGFGPAGMFAALVLAQAGMRPIVLERGDDAHARTKAVRAFEEGGALDAESNVQFGEGGAGTFSDGKLTTNIKDPRCRTVLEAFAAAGAPEEILWKAKPHIGTDLLPDIVANLRFRIESLGGEVRFRARMTKLPMRDGAVCGVGARDGRTGEECTIPARDVIVACGHSARDTFRMIHGRGFVFERKPFAMGVRIEHPQKLVDSIQYGSAAGHPALGAADYKLAVHLPSGRGVYTFCMCPGGQVVCAASEEGGVCVNGMSRFARDGANANAALLVEVKPGDLSGDDVFAGIELQRRVEAAAYRAGGGDYRAPAQTLGDFLEGKGAADPSRMVVPTYARGVAWCDLHDVLPEFIVDAIREAMPLLDAKMRGFGDPDAVLTAVEARSSSPVRIVRDRATLQARLRDTQGASGCAVGVAADRAESEAAGASSVGHIEVGRTGLFPAGEGAGYAGGIMSAAVDGMRAAEAVIAQYAEG